MGTLLPRGWASTGRGAPPGRPCVLHLKAVSPLGGAKGGRTHLAGALKWIPVEHRANPNSTIQGIILLQLCFRLSEKTDIMCPFHSIVLDFEWTIKKKS